MARGVRRLDAIVLSHADADHYNGLPDLLDRFPVGAVLVPPGFDAGDENPFAADLLKGVRARAVPVREVVEGVSWEASGTGFRFLVRHPPAGWGVATPDNARSVVLDVSAGGRHALLTGDIDGEGLATLMSGPCETEGPADVLLSPHHGGRTANPPALFEWADPAVVVVSQRAPAANVRDPLTLIESRGRPVLRTWKRGALTFRWAPEGVRARGFLDAGEADFPRGSAPDYARRPASGP